jgi:transposase
MSKKRRYFTAETKVAIIRKHFIEQIPVSDICDEHKITVSQFQEWQTIFFENGAKAFTKENGKDLKKSELKSAALEADLTQKNGVIAELVEENIRLKKQRGLI